MRYLLAMIVVGLMTGAAQAGEIRQLMQTSTDIVGGPISYPQGQAQVTAVEITVLPGEANTWHSHPVPTMGYTVSGILTVYYENGETRLVKAGETIVEAQHMPHHSRNEGTEVVKLIVFYIGAVDMPNTVPAKAP